MNVWQIFSDWLSIPSTGSLIGIGGILVAIFSIFLTRAVSKISSHLEFNSLIGGFESSLPKKINITYDDVPVEKVSSSVFIIWNSGNKVISGEALKTIDPLRIEASNGVEILRSNIQRTNNKTNNIQIKTDQNNKNNLLISFDYLEKKNGARIEILHTGDSDGLQVKGTLIDVKPLKRRTGTLHKILHLAFNNFKVIKISIAISGIIFAALLLLILLYTFIQPDAFKTTTPKPLNIWPFRIILFSYLIFILYAFKKIKPPYPSSLRSDNSKVNS
ncbi:hypothetical protein P2G42_20230 [Klebsiella electrica]|uniref:hypothetical protein n=1 Tax=Klebsiella electrica TaxID=1259973 RepID=UPI0025524919|nr:hypothetical protein [Klebsiella electrica]WIO42190.1 hypothetical protein P2G42_20230 [Klebsiella electrica]